MNDDPTITRNKIFKMTDIPISTIDKIISRLKSTNSIERIGSKKKGCWKVIK